MIKKITSILIVSALIITSGTFAFAAETTSDFTKLNEKVEIQRAINGISDLPITDKMQDACTAFLVDENGNKSEVETYVTVRRISSNARSGGIKYAMTAVARAKDKTSSGTAEPGDTNIDVTATGTIYWTDNFGTNNELTGVSGSWDAQGSSGTKNREAYYYTMNGVTTNNSNTLYPSGTSFDKSCSFFGTAVKLDTHADAYGPNGESERLSLHIEGTVFD